MIEQECLLCGQPGEWCIEGEFVCSAHKQNILWLHGSKQVVAVRVAHAAFLLQTIRPKTEQRKMRVGTWSQHVPAVRFGGMLAVFLAAMLKKLGFGRRENVTSQADASERGLQHRRR